MQDSGSAEITRCFEVANGKSRMRNIMYLYAAMEQAEYFMLTRTPRTIINKERCFQGSVYVGSNIGVASLGLLCPSPELVQVVDSLQFTV